jgi:hypothetical protein
LLAVAAVIAASVVAISVAGQASAQRNAPDPEELWEAYPLDPEGKRAEPPAPPGTTGSSETPTASPTPSPTPVPVTTPAAAPADDGGGLPVAALLAAALAAFTGGLAAGRARKRRNAAGPALSTAAPKLVTEPQLWYLGPRPSLSGRGSSPVEPETKPAESETKPAESETKPAESETKPAESAPEPDRSPAEPDAATPGFLEIAPPDPEELPLVEPEPAEPLELALPDPPPPPKPPKRGLERDVLEALDRDAPEVETRRLKPVDLDASGLRTPDPEPVARHEAPEVPTQDPEPAAHVARPAHIDPPAVPAPRPEPPVRRFERPAPWPEAEHMWTCELDWKPGYVRSCFRAMAAPPGGKRRRPIGESSSVRWTLMLDPEPPTPELVEAVQELADALKAAGWERTHSDGPWYALRFRWRGEGLPQRLKIQRRKAMKGTEDTDG